MKKAVVFFVVAAIASIDAYAVTCRADAKVDEKLPSVSAENGKPSALTVALAETSAFRETSTVSASKKPPYKVALIVQNHTSDAPTLPMAAFADTLTARLSGRMFRIVNPHNVIGASQNRTARGEEMPEASALNRLAHDPDLAGVITASIQEFTGRDIRHESKVIGHTLRVRLAINLMDATGGNVCGIDGFDDSKNCRPEDVKSNTATLYEELMHQAAAKAAAKLLAKVATSGWEPGEAKMLNVFFGCNVLGADVQIDGQSYGTCPAQISVTPGSHNLLVSYPPYYYEFRRRAIFNQEGQTYKVVLQLTPDGEAQRNRTLEYEMKRTELDKALAGLEKTKNDNVAEYEKKKLALEREKKAIEGDEKERVELFAKQLELADAMLERYGKSGDADDYVRRTVADGTAVYWKNSYGRIAITSGTANKIDFATPATDVGDIVYPPDPGDIGKGLKNLLMLKPRATVEVQEAIKSQTSGNVERQ